MYTYKNGLQTTHSHLIPDRQLALYAKFTHIYRYNDMAFAPLRRRNSQLAYTLYCSTYIKSTTEMNPNEKTEQNSLENSARLNETCEEKSDVTTIEQTDTLTMKHEKICSRL